MIRIKFNALEKDTEEFGELVQEVLQALRKKTEVSMNGFSIMPVQVALEGSVDDTNLTVEGYIK
jgi:hypothetical protein